MKIKFRSLSIATFLLICLFSLMISCSSNTDIEDISSSSNGEIITNLTASAMGGGSPFDGTVDALSDLDDLIEAAWGDGSLDLHRGHAPIQNILEAFLGISHDDMHTFMEELSYNLADVCTHFGFDSENLVASLTASFDAYLDEGISNGVITNEEKVGWRDMIETQFRNRVNWEG